VQQSDGLFVRRLPAALLREMNIVDTPGAAEKQHYALQQQRFARQLRCIV
jgi:hypothetical protein